MAKSKTRLELTWIGKEYQRKLEPSDLIEDKGKSYYSTKRESTKRELFDAQEVIDKRWEEMIGRIGEQLKQTRIVQGLFTIHWRVQ